MKQTNDDEQWLASLDGKHSTEALKTEIQITRLAVLAQDKQTEANKRVLNRVIYQLKQEKLIHKPKPRPKSTLITWWRIPALISLSLSAFIILTPYLYPLNNAHQFQNVITQTAPYQFKSTELIPQTIQVKHPYQWALQLQQQLDQQQIDSQIKADQWLARWQLLLPNYPLADQSEYILISSPFSQDIADKLKIQLEQTGIKYLPQIGLSLKIQANPP